MLQNRTIYLPSTGFAHARTRLVRPVQLPQNLRGQSVSPLPNSLNTIRMSGIVYGETSVPSAIENRWWLAIGAAKGNA